MISKEYIFILMYFSYFSVKYKKYSMYVYKNHARVIHSIASRTNMKYYDLYLCMYVKNLFIDETAIVNNT